MTARAGIPARAYRLPLPPAAPPETTVWRVLALTEDVTVSFLFLIRAPNAPRALVNAVDSFRGHQIIYGDYIVRWTVEPASPEEVARTP